MKAIYWKKIEVWCKYPFQHEIDYRYIEFHSKKRHNYKTKLSFHCASTVVGKNRVSFVANELGLNPKNVKLVKQ
ncbi:hypothetical protein DS884_00935 [Tenacibaculum sp. E3R01]|uniref:hypothetical protein n=1 Tax=Tenacibaculum sp. E3R01 TaxID=2267227 RepID=UPI000DE90189|nr:hypothetical protein [Tenacibaculum sp. E3R01]RBW62909.1 hypothetical protein DS884_00935 [Tenacibaculum sp. E3R01]